MFNSFKNKINTVESTFLNLTLVLQSLNFIRYLNDYFKWEIEKLVYSADPTLIVKLKELLMFFSWWSLLFYTFIWFLKIYFNSKQKHEN